jgi:predicted nuclease of predicted toxin-antitoxin system
MTLWLDAQLSPRIARWITDHFTVTAIPLRDVGLRDAEDDAIWAAARNANVVVLTKDADFEERVRRFGPPPQVIWLTCGNTSEARLKQIFEAHLQTALDLLKSGNPLVEIQ